MSRKSVKKTNRSKACEIAKILARQKGGHPCQYLKDGWKVVKGEATLEGLGIVSNLTINN